MTIPVDGVSLCRASSWELLDKLILTFNPFGKDYIWRGQREDWPLLPKLYRKEYLGHSPGPHADGEIHRKQFESACRGRRGRNPQLIRKPAEWWALGQHNGLATPLMDWTESPYVAAFFAFEEEAATGDNRAIYALRRTAPEAAARELGHPSRRSEDGSDGLVHVFSPTSDENPRLISQAGIFTYGPASMDIESWVKATFRGVTDATVFIKVLIPDTDRRGFLMYLNRMNINHLSLFPDLYGAAMYCNMRLRLPGY